MKVHGLARDDPRLYAKPGKTRKQNAPPSSKPAQPTIQPAPKKKRKRSAARAVVSDSDDAEMSLSDDSQLDLLVDGGLDHCSDEEGESDEEEPANTRALTAIVGCLNPVPCPFFLVDDTRQFWGKPEKADPFKGPYRPSWRDNSDGQELQSLTRPIGRQVVPAIANFGQGEVICEVQVDQGGLLTTVSVCKLVECFELEAAELEALVPRWAKQLKIAGPVQP